MLSICLYPSEDEGSNLAIPVDGCLVQFISCAQEEHMKFELRRAERVTNRLLKVMSPGEPLVTCSYSWKAFLYWRKDGDVGI